MSLAICLRCNRETTKPARGLCHTCYSFWWRNSKDRPVIDKETRKCENCGDLTGKMFRRGLCNKCYTYWLRTGEQRPLNPTNDLRIERPIELAGRQLIAIKPDRTDLS